MSDETTQHNTGEEADEVEGVEMQRQSEMLLSESIDRLPLISDVLDLLDKKLPKNLYYHSKSHTDDVLREAVLFGLVDGLSHSQMKLLAIAAAYHDAGYIESPVDNERIGANMARAALEKYGGFTDEEIELVARMIMDTRLVETRHGLSQVPTTDLSRYLLDADLSNFGRDDFFIKGELQRKELGYDRSLFMRKTYELINNHRWLTNAALKLRQKQKSINIQQLKEILQGGRDDHLDTSSLEMGVERLIFLGKMPLLLNSSLDTRKIVETALEHLRSRVSAEAATVFLLDDSARELTFWALKGGDNSRLGGMKMPADRGIVGWVISNQEPVLVKDVKNDARFFSVIDQEGGGFITRDLICVPLTVRGNTTLGALQVLNKGGGLEFTEDDLLFVEQFANQVALAIDNSRLYEALRERNAQLQSLDRRKNEMIQVISHEFRTPLNVIQTSAELIASGALRDEKAVKDISGTLERGVERLTRIMSQIRNISFVTQEKLEINLAPVSVNELVEKVLAKYKEGAAARKIRLKPDLGKTTIKVLGDFSLLLVVLDNLVSNAIRFTPDGGVVDIRVLKQSGFARISVSDNGIGMDESEIPLIFEKFYEVGDALEHSSGELEFKSGGLGLGLATVKSILRAHGSNIEVISAPKKGSEFSFNLPVSE